MSFPDAVKSVLSQYATFTGRASRSEYWWFYLFTVLLSFGTGAVDTVLDTGVVGALTSLVLLLPSIAVTVRRLHDSNLSGWWFLLPLGTAVVGVVALVLGVASLFAAGLDSNGMGSGDTAVAAAVLLVVAGLGFLASLVSVLVLMLRASTPGANRFGPHPNGTPPGVGAPNGPGGYGYGYGPQYGSPSSDA